MAGYRHFVFDLDGTLIDTESAILQTWQRLLERYGYHFSLRELRPVLGVTTQHGLERLGARVDDGFEAEWQAEYRAFAPQADFFAGVESMLDALKTKGCVLGAVSSRNRSEYAEFFARFRLERWMSAVVLEEDTKQHKPAPEPLLKYMELAGAQRGECVYVGDMPSDIACANAAGVCSALVRWNGSDVERGDASLVLGAPSDVLELVG